MYYFKALISEESLKMTYRDNGLVAADSMEKAMTLLKETFSGEDNIIKLSITPVEAIISGWELDDIVEKDYYKEQYWSDVSEKLTL